MSVEEDVWNVKLLNIRQDPRLILRQTWMSGKQNIPWSWILMYYSDST